MKAERVEATKMMWRVVRARRARVLYGIVAATVAALLAGCGGGNKPYGGYTLSELGKLPEEHLFYPGAEVIDRLGQEAFGGPARPHPALSGCELGVQATPAEIEAFYDRELQGRGWGAQMSVGQSTAEERAVGWTKNNLLLRVAVRRKGDPRNPPEGVTGKYATIYDIMVTPVVSKP